MNDSFFDEMKHNNVEEVTTPKVGSIFVPTLTASGWVNSIAESVDYLLSYYFTTYKSQSYLHKDSLVSLQYTIEKYGNNQFNLTDKIRSDLENMLNKYFVITSIDVKVKTDGLNNSTERYEIYTTVNIYRDGVHHSVGYLITLVDSKLLKFARLNNGAA